MLWHHRCNHGKSDVEQDSNWYMFVLIICGIFITHHQSWQEETFICFEFCQKQFCYINIPSKSMSWVHSLAEFKNLSINDCLLHKWISRINTLKSNSKYVFSERQTKASPTTNDSGTDNYSTSNPPERVNYEVMLGWLIVWLDWGVLGIYTVHECIAAY